jgi:biopolymer transport protein ExbB/TolQ
MLCLANPHPFSAVAHRLLTQPGTNEASSYENIHVGLSEQKMLFEKNLGLMATMAAIAPLIGLLGTVVGIMRAFGNMAKIGSASPSVVAAGVAEALMTTAAGLVVAVPAVVLYNHLSRRMNNTLTVAENNARALRVTMRETPGFVPGEGSRAGGPGQPARSTSPSVGSARTPASVG